MEKFTPLSSESSIARVAAIFSFVDLFFFAASMSAALQAESIELASSFIGWDVF